MITTTITPARELERNKYAERPTLVRDLPEPPAHTSDNPLLDPTQGRKIGSDPYDDPTQGRKIGADPYDDPTQGQKIGSDPYDDPTRGR